MGNASDVVDCVGGCSGHGACVNGFCRCEDGWHGQTDIVNFEGYDCPMPRAAELVSWGLATAGAILITIRHVKALQAQRQAFGRLAKKANAKGKKLFWYKHVPLSVVVLGLCTLCPGSLVVCLYKMADLPNRRIGTDIIPSIAYFLVGLPGFLGNVMHEIRTYEVLVRSSSLRSKSGTDHLHVFMTKWYYRTLACYGIGFATAVLAGCFVPEAPPAESVGPKLLIFRVTTTIIFLVSMAKINMVVAGELKKMIEVMSSQVNKSAETNKAQAVLDFVEHSARAKRKSCVAGSILLIVSAFPALWPHHNMFMVFLYCNTTLTKSHPVCTYLGQGNKVRDDNATTAASTSSFKGESSVAATSALSTDIVK